MQARGEAKQNLALLTPNKYHVGMAEFSIGDEQSPKPPEEPIPLTRDEILQIANKGLGLRNTSPDELAEHAQEGFYGDFYKISDLNAFLKIDPNSKRYDIYQKFKMFDVTSAIRNGDMESLQGLDDLADRYNQALNGVIEDSIMFRTKALFEGEPNTTLVDSYISAVTKAFPAFELIADPNGRAGRDREAYRGFGKEGTGHIETDRILASTAIAPVDTAKIRESFRSHLGSPVVNHEEALDHNMHTLMASKVVSMIRGQLKAV